MITKQDFEAYEDCRSSGATNMMALGNVMHITGLPKPKILEIMHNYSDLKKEYLTK